MPGIYARISEDTQVIFNNLNNATNFLVNAENEGGNQYILVHTHEFDELYKEIPMKAMYYEKMSRSLVLLRFFN